MKDSSVKNYEQRMRIIGDDGGPEAVHMYLTSNFENLGTIVMSQSHENNEIVFLVRKSIIIKNWKP